MKFLRSFFFSVALLGVSFSADAQTFGAALNISALTFGNSTVNDSINASLDSNLKIGVYGRFFSKTNWAFKVGAGFNNFKFQLDKDGDVNTHYDNELNNIFVVVGVEKHFEIADFITVYPGIQVPITFIGDNKVFENGGELNLQDAIQKDNMQLGFSVLAGANVKLLKFLRLGVEFDTSFKQFRTQFLNDFVNTDNENRSNINLKNVEYTTSFVIGVVF